MELKNPVEALNFFKKSSNIEHLLDPYHLGILFGLNKKFEKCRTILSKYIDNNADDERDWVIEKRQFISKILNILQTPNKFKTWIEDVILETRSLKKLPVISKDQLWKTKDSKEINIAINKSL